MGDSSLLLCAIQILHTKSARLLLCANTMLTSMLTRQSENPKSEDSPSIYGSPLQALLGGVPKSKNHRRHIKDPRVLKVRFWGASLLCGMFLWNISFSWISFQNRKSSSYVLLCAHSHMNYQHKVIILQLLVEWYMMWNFSFIFFINWQATCTFISKCFVFENIEISVWWNKSDA